MITFGSLFAGIGGFDLGLERAGMECRWQVEKADFPYRILQKHWPDVPKYREVRDVGRETLETVDLIAGGFPCQPHSLAGERRGAKDDRNLWPEFKRVIEELRPRWVIAENVPGIIYSYLDTVLSDLEGSGYTVGTLNLPAGAFDAPHRRERIFVVAHTAGEGLAQREEEGVGVIIQPVRGRGDEGRAQNVADATGDVEGARSQAQGEDGGRAGHLLGSRQGRGLWPTEPRVGRVADGVPDRVDRIKALGNAVVPQVAEFIGRQIVAVEHGGIDGG